MNYELQRARQQCDDLDRRCTEYANLNADLLAALARLRASISDYDGHGNPGCPDRAEAYLAMAEADTLLAKARGQHDIQR